MARRRLHYRIVEDVAGAAPDVLAAHETPRDMPQTTRRGTPARRYGAALVGVLGFAVVVLAIPVGRAPIWEPNDARYVLLARDVVERGHWLVPEVRGVRHEGLYKPQLYFWSIALVSLPPGRVTEFTAAIPSVVSAIAGVVGVVAIGSLLWDLRSGVLAGLILTTTPNYFEFAHHSLPDVMMSAFMVWALYFLLRSRHTRCFGSLLGFYVCVGAAMLSKGPPGLAALLAAAAATWWGDGRAALRELRPGLGAVTLVIVALPWFVPYLFAAQPAFIHEVLVGEYALWFFRKHGLVYRLAHMPSVLVYFLPWTLYLFAAIAWWRRDGADAGRRYVIGWTVTVFVLAGLSGMYRARYYLPVYPGLALLTGEFFAHAMARAVRRELWLGSIAFVVMAITVVLVMAFPVVLSGEGAVYMPDTGPERVVIASLAMIGAVGVALAIRRATVVSTGVLVALVMGSILAVEGNTSPIRRAHHYDIRSLAAVATAHTPVDGTVIGYPDLSLVYDVYLQRRTTEIASEEEVARRLAAPSKDVMIMTRRRWDALVGVVAPVWHLLKIQKIGDQEMVVVGSSPR
jgi:4-amino-4-deoxy-L-arabinose transferase-like glycosyltransferase